MKTVIIYGNNLENDYVVKVHGYYNMYLVGKEEKEILKTYLNNGWIKLNKIVCGGLGGNTIKWSYEKCEKEALKFKTRNEFRKNSYGAYNRARKKGWLDKVCSHMRCVSD